MVNNNVCHDYLKEKVMIGLCQFMQQRFSEFVSTHAFHVLRDL